VSHAGARAARRVAMLLRAEHGAARVGARVC
jgi:hypothetical protein